MKTSKKIVALVLTLCMIFSLMAVSVSADDATTETVTAIPTIKHVYNYDANWDKWDEDGQFKTKVNVSFSNGAMSVNFKDAIDYTLFHYDGMGSARYTVAFDFTIDGPNAFTIPVNAIIQGTGNGVSTLWFTSVVPFTGEIAQEMIAAAETDETLRALLYIEDADEVNEIAGGVICKNDNTHKPMINGEQAADTYTALSKENLLIYLDYKAGNDGSRRTFHNTDVEAVVTTPYTVAYAVPKGSIFIDENSLINFAYSWAVQGDTYTLGNNTIITTAKDNGSNLDLSYAVFEAPTTDEYAIYAFTRNRTEHVGTSGNRDAHIEINGEHYYFPCDNSPIAASDTPAYYWEEENAGRADREQRTVSLTKGQKFVVQVPAESRAYVGCYGFLLVPVSEAVTVEQLALAKSEAKLPSRPDDFKQYNILPYTPADAEAVIVSVNGVDVTVNANVSNDAFPNSRLFDKGGNFIEGATVLDAVFAADAADESYALTAATWDSTNHKLTNGNVVDGNFTEKYITTVNGYYCTAMDQVEIKAGDVIEVKARDITQITLSANGGADVSYGDVIAGVNGSRSKFNIDHGDKLVHIVEDSTVMNAYAGYYLVGYAPILIDFVDTNGDDTLSWNRFDIPILASGYKADGTTLQFGYEAGPHTESVDGKNYYMSGFSSGQIQAKPQRYDLSHTYISKNALPENATVKAEEIINGVILYTDAPQLVTLTRVVKEGGAIKSVTTEHRVLDMMEGGQFVPVAEGETLYVWKGLKITTGTSAVPACAPISK